MLLSLRGPLPTSLARIVNCSVSWKAEGRAGLTEVQVWSRVLVTFPMAWMAGQAETR